MVARLTEALALTLRVHLLQAEHDCNTAPLDLPGDLEVPPPASVHASPVSQRGPSAYMGSGLRPGVPGSGARGRPHGSAEAGRLGLRRRAARAAPRAAHTDRRARAPALGPAAPARRAC
jgi:hypothetical protein